MKFKITRKTTKQTYPNYGVLVMEPNNLTDKEIEEIMAADWFEPANKKSRNLILVDCSQLSEELGILMESPFDYGINPHQDQDPIDDCLKRWNEKDGFYHA